MQNRMRWVLIFWLFIISAIAYLDRVNVSVAIGAIQKEFNFTNIQFGWIMSAFVVGYAAFQAPGGRLADKFGPRKILTLGVLCWGVFTTVTALIPSGIAGALAIMIVVRFILGVGEAVVYPASNRLVANWIPSRERGIANGLIFAGVGFGAGITLPIITYVLPKYGWRWSFFVCAIAGTVAGIVWWMISRDDPREHPSVTAQEWDLISRGLPQPATELKGHKTTPWRAILRSKDVLAVGASYFTFGYVAYIFFTWFFKYLNDVRGLDLKASGLYGMLPFLAMSTCSTLGGWIADQLTMKHGRRIGRCGIAVFGLALAGVFIALATQVESARLASVVLAGGAGALYLSQSSYWAVTADIAGPSAGSVSGLMNMGGQIGGAVTASLTPWIAQEFGWTASFLTAAVLCVLGSLTWLLVNPDAQLRHEPVRKAA
jgi:ACS family glucarate transporter-like MFS transporter